MDNSQQSSMKKHEVRKSSIHGNGVFAICDIKEGERIIAMSITDKDEQNEEIVAEEKAETAEETLTPPQTEE